MNDVAEKMLSSQRTTTAEIMALLDGDTALERVRTALLLAYNRGFTAGLDAAQSIYSPSTIE